MRSMLVRKLLASSEISIDCRLPQFTLRLLSSFEQDPPPPLGSIESLPDWDSPLEIPQESRDKAIQDIDHEMEELLERKFEEDDIGTGSFDAPQGLPNKEAIHRALAVFEEEFKKSENSEKTVPLQFSSKFGTFKSSFMRELTDVGLDDPIDLPSEKHLPPPPNGLISDFVHSSYGGDKADSMVESFFGPEGGQKRYQKVLFSDRKDLLQEVNSGFAVSNRSTPSSKGGFRISVYRNVTGSVKRLLQSVRNEVLPKFIAKIPLHNSENHEFLTSLIESLEFADHNGEDAAKRYILPQMNTICLMFLERLPYLTSNEIALVCLVFGKLGYVNSLVFHRLFGQLQKEGVLSTMSNEGLFGTVLSLGMLQSTEPEFLNLAKREFESRFVKSTHREIPKDSIGCFLFGICRSRDPEQATSLSESVLDFICQDELLMNEDSVSWSDLGLALYVTHQLNIWKPALIQGVHQRLLKNRGDLNCNEASVLLLGLEHQPPSRVKTEVRETWAQSFSLLQDSIEEMISQNKIDVMSIPDIIKSFTFPGYIRVHCFEELGKKIIASGELSAPISLWSISYKLMAGYANVRYRDADVLKALNKRFLETRMGAISPRTVVQLLHVGLTLKGLEEAVVDRIVEAMSASPHFWKKIYRSKDAARASYALAGFQKLTPEILKCCWERCQEVKFSEVDSMEIEEKLETTFIAQGLFSGYQYIASTYSPEIASHQIPESGKNRIFNLIKKRNLYDSGSETKSQSEVSSTLASMGISIACPVLIMDGLYSVDMALHHKKVVVFLFKDRSYYANPPFAINGRALMHVRELEAQDIKVVCIKEQAWLSLTPEQRPSYLESKFTEHGLSIQELKSPNPVNAVRETFTSEELKIKMDRFLRDRMTVLKELKLSRLRELFETRQSLETNSEDVFQKLAVDVLNNYELLPPSKAKTKQTETPKTKRAIIQRILAFEAEQLFGTALGDTKSITDHDLTATG